MAAKKLATVQALGGTRAWYSVSIQLHQRAITPARAVRMASVRYPR